MKNKLKSKVNMNLTQNINEVKTLMKRKPRERTVKVKDTSREVLEIVKRLLAKQGVGELKTTSLDLVKELPGNNSRDTVVRRLKDLAKMKLVELRTETNVGSREPMSLFIKLTPEASKIGSGDGVYNGK